MTAGSVSVTPETGNKTTEPDRIVLPVAVFGHVAQFVAEERRRIRPPMEGTPFVVGVPPGFVTRQGSQRQQSS